LNPIKKLFFSLNCPTFVPHAAKAQNKKIWYLRDQRVVATTGQTNHQTAQKAEVTDQKDPLPHQQENHLARAAAQIIKKLSR
jgi:hypothetical protein